MTELEEGLIDRHKEGVAGATLQLQDFGEHKYPGCGGWLMVIPWMESGELGGHNMSSLMRRNTMEITPMHATTAGSAFANPLQLYGCSLIVLGGSFVCMGMLTANEQLNPLCPKRLKVLPSRTSISKIPYVLCGVDSLHVCSTATPSHNVYSCTL